MIEEQLFRTDMGIFLVCLVLAGIFLFTRISIRIGKPGEEGEHDSNFEGYVDEVLVTAAAWRVTTDLGETWTVYSYDPTDEVGEDAIVRPLYDLEDWADEVEE